MTLLMLIGFSFANATDVVVGTQESNKLTNLFPTNPYTAYSLTEQIYTPAEIGTNGSITSISFYRDWTSESVDELNMPGLKLYMKHTTSSKFNNNTDMIALNESDLVWEGNFIAPSVDYKGWVTIELDEPFQYNGTDNLLIAFYDTNPQKTEANTNKFYYVTTTENSALAYYSNDVVPDLSSINSYSGSTMPMKAHNYVKFNIVQRVNFEVNNLYESRAFPVYTNYNYCLTEQIYTAAEVGEAKAINSLSFFMTSDVAYSRNIKLYLMHTDKEAFDNDDDFLSYSNSNMVFQGNVNFVPGDWTTITFDVAFPYNGTQNLAVIFVDETGTYTTRYFLAYPAGSYQGLFSYTDNFVVGASNATDATHTRDQSKAQMRINNGDIIGEMKATMPFNAGNAYSLSQQIYFPTDFITTPNAISSISFYNKGAETTRNIDLYLVHISKYKFDSATDWIPFTESDKVFSGNVTFGEDEWTAIQFDKYFDYDGNSYVALIIDDNTGEAADPVQFSAFYSSYARTNILSGSSNYTASNISSYEGTVGNYLNAIRVNDKGLNFKPTSIEVSDITWDGATVSWTSRGSKWNLQLFGEGYADWVTYAEGLTEPTFTFHDLTPERIYQVRVQTNHNGELSDWASSAFATDERYHRPTGIEASDITSHSAIIKWQDNCDAKRWQVYVYEENSSGSTTNQWSVIADSNPFILTGLKQGYKYYVYVRAVIDEENEVYSNWSDDYEAFTTPKANPDIHFAGIDNITPSSATIAWEGGSSSYQVRYRKYVPEEVVFFDDFESGDLTTNGWDVSINDGDSPGWTVSGYEGNAVLWSPSYNSSTAYNADCWAITPQVDLKGVLMFKELNYSSTYPDTYEVLLSTTGKAKEDFTTVLLPMHAPTVAWTDVEIDLSAYEGQQGYIALHHVSTDQFRLFIDDFGIYDFSGQEPWQTLNETTEKSVTIEGLDADTEYEVEVLGLMQSQEPVSTGRTTFTTLAKNPAPYDFSVNAAATTANVSWTGYGNLYEVKYRTAGGSFFEDFESKTDGTLPEGWTTIDADGDGNTWFTFTSENYVDANGNPAFFGNTTATSASWVGSGALTPDNWLISPAVPLDGTLSVWLRGQDPNFASEHFAIYLSTATTITDVSDFNVTLVGETVAQDELTEYTADLSAYAGQIGHIAIRHYNISDMFRLNVDNFSISGEPGPWVTKYVSKPEIALTGLMPGTSYEVQVTSQMSGEPDATSEVITFVTNSSDPIDLAFDNYGDNTSTISANDGVLANVTINNLYFPDGQWVPVTLPFDLDVASSPFTEARMMDGYETKGSTLLVNFLTPVTTMQAGIPYLVKVDRGDGGNLVDPVFNNVTINATRNNYYVDDMVFWYALYKEYYCDVDYPYNLYVSDFGRQLKTLYQSCWLYAFQPYFYYDGDLTGFDQILVNTGDGTNDYVTGIGSVESETGDEIIYNVAGQRLAKKQKGVNIVNGKKVLVK